MNSLRDICWAVLIAVLAVGLYFSGQLILSTAGPLTGYQRLEGLLGLAASTAGVVLVVWWTIALTLAFVSEILARTGLHRAAQAAATFSPRFMKRLAVSVLGLQLVVGAPLSAAAQLTTPPGQSPGGDVDPIRAAPERSLLTKGAMNPTQASEDTSAPEPQWKPLPRPMDGSPLLQQENRRTAPPGPPPAGFIEVEPGDSLWTIAARHLGPFATDVEIARAWPRWHQENHHLIGDDPHLLRPGQVLRAPSDHH